MNGDAANIATIPAGKGAPQGLTSAEARELLAQHGENLLPEPNTPSFLVIFLRQFRSPLIYILLLAAGVSLAISGPEDAIFIAIVLVLNGIIGGLQEHSAGRAAAALRKLEQPHAKTIRDGEVTEIEARLLVPGDVALLEAGARVPADIVLFETHDLQCDESLLTGESLPVRKQPANGAKAGEDGDSRRSAALAGTLVTRGRGRGIVTATGIATEIGRIASEINRDSMSKPPLMTRLEHFSNIIAWAVGVTTLLLVGVGLLRGIAWNELFLMSVGLAVSAIPEGLPVAISVALAIGMRRMARENVIVRRMPAVEALGSCTMIATDKTGTLTLNRQTVTDLRLPDGTALSLGNNGAAIDNGAALSGARLLRAAILANEATLASTPQDDIREENGVGDTVDIALLAAAGRTGIDRDALMADFPLLDRIPYESDIKYTASLHRDRDSGTRRIFVKGAPDIVFAMASRMLAGDGELEIDRDALLRQQNEMAGQGLRVLAFAEGEYHGDDGAGLDAGDLRDLVFLGLSGMQDPIRAEVPDAIARCHAAGVGVVMITGDDPRTAAAIARRAGLEFSDESVVTGEEVRSAEAEGEASLDALTRRARVYARVVPTEKLAIVLSLARNGHFVAVTGDGVNDAPALKHAHVGVAMGLGGTEVAKESAGIVITDDNFASIVSGIREGRTAYGNIRKVILMLVATGVAEMLIFLLAIPLGLPMPLTPVQLLWLNLVTNGIQDVALAAEKGEGDELSQPPRRPKEPIFDRLMIRRVIQSALVIGLGGFAVFSWLLQQGYELSQARNILLLLIVMFENVQVLACRSERRSLFALPFFGNPLLLLAIIAAHGIHIAAMYIPWLRDTLELSPITATEWILTLLAAFSLLLVSELDKWRSRRKAAAA